MASYGNDEIGWKKDQRDAAWDAMNTLADDRSEQSITILRWDGRTDSRADRKVEAFRIIPLDGAIET